MSGKNRQRPRLWRQNPDIPPEKREYIIQQTTEQKHQTQNATKHLRHSDILHHRFRII